MLSLLLLDVAFAARFTILHTNDWQSRLLGYGPNAAYSPETVNDDPTVGGVARLSTLIAQRRAAAAGPVLLLDGGDVTMGSLFHTVTRETGAELRLMHRLGYDATTLGNHEFDFRPDGLAQMISAAQAAEGCPPLLSVNLQLDPEDARDDGLEALRDDGTIRPWVVVERGGLRFGLLGVTGMHAYGVIGQAEPVVFTDPIPAIRQAAQALRSEEAVDVVVLLSHSGVLREGGTWTGEEIDYVTEIPEIDVVVGGHSHTPIREPIDVDGRLVVQAGSELQFLGELVMDVSPGQRPAVVSYTLHPIDDTIPGDPDVTAFVDQIQQEVTGRILAPQGYTFDQVLAASDRALGRSFEEHVLANHVTDALRTAAGADIAVTGNGTIRDNVRPGRQWVSDLFRISALGIGTTDDTPGYALMKIWTTGADLKSIFEFLLIGYQLKGPSYFPRISGAQVRYNNWRVPFDRVYQVAVGDDQRGYEVVDLSDDRLYSVAVTSYIASFLPDVPETTFGLLDATVRDASGAPVSDLSALLVDGDPARPGTQELKAYRALLDHLSGFPDTDGDGVADIPTGGPVADSRLVQADSLSPRALLGEATWKMWAAVLALPAALLALAAAWRWRRRRRR